MENNPDLSAEIPATVETRDAILREALDGLEFDYEFDMGGTAAVKENGQMIAEVCKTHDNDDMYGLEIGIYDSKGYGIKAQHEYRVFPSDEKIGVAEDGIQTRTIESQPPKGATQAEAEQLLAYIKDLAKKD